MRSVRVPFGFPWVVHPVFLLDEFLVDVRVNLRGTDVGVTEEFLQYSQIHSGL